MSNTLNEMKKVLSELVDYLDKKKGKDQQELHLLTRARTISQKVE